MLFVPSCKPKNKKTSNDVIPKLLRPLCGLREPAHPVVFQHLVSPKRKRRKSIIESSLRSREGETSRMFSISFSLSLFSPFLSFPLFFSLLFSLFREKWSPFFAVDRDPDQDHCQDDVKGVILTSRRVCPDELLFCHPVVLLYGISHQRPAFQRPAFR